MDRIAGLNLIGENRREPIQIFIEHSIQSRYCDSLRVDKNYILMDKSQCQELFAQLQNALGLLQLQPSHPLRQQAIALEHSLQQPTFRIAVFGPFNYGKSTLLNAILGDRTLPIDLIPTTGAAICVRYGDSLRTEIHLKEGQTIAAENADILKDYAILDEQRRMREDVAAVDVYCPHPWLKLGVELLDLPGTDDQEAQDELVRDRLLTTDLIVQVLDGRKMMTLGEREHLRDWLLDRGIETVVFVVNFLNLLDSEDQKQVASRMRFVAESFRAKLPPGVSNLYRVDALPALRARLKGDGAAAQTSGLTTFESALQAIVQQSQQQPQSISPRCLRQLKQLLQEVQAGLQQKITGVEQEIQRASQRQVDHRLSVQRKAQTLIQTGFRDSLTYLRQWAELPKLYATYAPGFATALGQFEFDEVLKHSLRQDWDAARQDVMGWVYRACDFFQLPRPVELSIAFPPPPILQFPDTPSIPQSSAGESLSPVAIATGLGWLVGGPMGAAVLGGASYFLNQIPGSEATPSATTSSSDDWQANCSFAARAYLEQFHQRAIVALDDYEARVRSIIECPLNAGVATGDSPQQHYLNLLRSTWMSLQQENL
jgi:GTPase SAR1 family protein